MPLHLQGMLLVQQMALTDTQASASRVSLLTIGQQAIMDAYLCLLHLTTGKPQLWPVPRMAGLLAALAGPSSEWLGTFQGGVSLFCVILLMILMLLTPAACDLSSVGHWTTALL